MAVYTAKVGDVAEARRQVAELLWDVQDREGLDSSYAIELEALVAYLAQLDRGSRAT